jgi:mannose-6-phosphate isomerase-like protein (cupin superfamily)
MAAISESSATESSGSELSHYTDYIPCLGIRGITNREKVWGREIWMVNNELYCSKFLVVHPGSSCSLHRHLVKDETFVVLAGQIALEMEGNSREMKATDSQRIPAGTWHRFTNPDNSTWGLAIVLEVSTHHDDEDVERLEPSRGNEAYKGRMREIAISTDGD